MDLDLSPSIHLLAVMLRPLSALVFVWLRPESGACRQKKSVCHGDRAKVLALHRSGGAVVEAAVLLHCCFLDPHLVLTQTSPYFSIVSFLILFEPPSEQAEKWKRRRPQCSAVTLVVDASTGNGRRMFELLSFSVWTI